MDGTAWIHPDAPPRPAIVMPSPWTVAGWRTCTVAATTFALGGYNVLACSAPGVGATEGEVEAGGEWDVQDGSKALDCLLAHAPGHTTKVGFTGLSYGSGLSRLITARDRRVDAVAALSAWGDPGEASTRTTPGTWPPYGPSEPARDPRHRRGLRPGVPTG